MAVKGLPGREGYVVDHLNSAWSHYTKLEESFGGEHDILLGLITQAKLLMMARPITALNQKDLAK